MYAERNLKTAFNKKISLEHKGEYQTVETSTGHGIPDVVIKVPGKPEFWVETKQTPNMYGPLLRPPQRAWGYSWAKKGGLVWVVDKYSPEYDMEPSYRAWLLPPDRPIEIFEELVNNKYVRIKEGPTVEAHTLGELVNKILDTM